MSQFSNSNNGYTLYFNIWEDWYDIASNKSRVKWSLQLNSTTKNFSTHTLNWGIVIDGNTVRTSGSDGHLYPASIGKNSSLPLDSGSIDITHNSDGTKSINFSVAFSTSAGSYMPGSISISNSIKLTDIPRYTQIHASVSSVGLNSIEVKWTTDDNISVIQYRRDSGSWVDVETDMNANNGQFTISGLNPNTTYNIDLDAKRRDSGLWSFSAGKGASFSRTTKDIAKISSYTSSTNLGDSYAIKYTNPSGAKVQVGIYDTDGIDYYAEYRTVTDSSYTFNFTDAELDSMYKAMGKTNSLSAKLYINTADNTYRESKDITIKLTGNQKTEHVKINNSWKRAKRWVNVNGTWKRAVRWVNVNGTWKRCI